MSIMQEYEQIRKEIGTKKYDAIEEYLNEICPNSQYDKYNKKLNSLIDLSTEEWLQKKAELEKEYGIVFLSDVLYKPEEWEKFETWYENRKTYIIKVWENEDLREQGLSDILEVGIEDLKTAIARAKELFENNDYASMEVQTGDEQDTMYFKDKKEEKYYNLEEISSEKEDELDEP